MVKDETNVEEGTVEEEDLLDFDLDDLASEEGTEPGEDEEIIELVDLVEEDAVEDAGGEAADIEMLLQDEVSPGTSDEEAGEADDFDSMLSDVDLDETEADIDMSDVALDLDLGFGEEEGEQAEDVAPGGDAGPGSIPDEDSGEEISFDFEVEEDNISEDDFQKMLEDESEEGFNLDLTSEPGPDDTAFDPPVEEEAPASPEAGAEQEESYGDDITEEALERMLEDETEGEAEPLEQEAEEEVRITTSEETVVEATPGTPETPPVSEERIEEIVRGVVEEVVTREIRQSMSDVAERVIRESVTDAAERVIRETIEALKAGLDTAGE